MKVIFTAAHGGFQGEHAPLGGGAAVCDLLCAEWARTKPFEVVLFRPEHVKAHDITGFDTRSYGRFCHEFGRAATEFIRRHDPHEVAVICNDISEGPDFRALAEQGYRIVTLWHVDVIAYVAAIYARGLVRPRTLVRMQKLLGPLAPEILPLIFQKQEECLLYSQAHVLPSPAMAEVIRDTFPGVPAERLHVIPWGAPPADGDAPERGAARAAFHIPMDAFVLLMLSRLSPEKNQQAVLEAVAAWEKEGDFPSRPFYILLCGAAAYMQGRDHETLLRRCAARLRRAKVIFAGHVFGERKRSAFAAADLYVFPSKHESYGLTLMEAFSAGLPALTVDHAGASAIMRREFGRVAAPGGLLKELKELVAADLPRMGHAAREFALAQPFSDAARRVAELALPGRRPEAIG